MHLVKKVERLRVRRFKLIHFCFNLIKLNPAEQRSITGVLGFWGFGGFVLVYYWFSSGK